MTSSQAIPAPGSVAVLADTDSRWKWGVQLAGRLGAQVVITGYQLTASAARPSDRQLAAAGIAPEQVRNVSASGLLDALAADLPEVLIVALPGGGCQAMLHLLAAADLPRRPLVVTGYVGVVYEKLVEGLLLRAGADLVAANSPADLDRFRAVYAGAQLDPKALTLTRLPFLADQPRNPSGRFTVTFAPQPGVPAARWQRRYLVRRLAGHARRHPDRDVVVKLRSLPGERVTHTELYPFHGLVEELGSDRPENLKLVSGDMGAALAGTDLLVTVSSTAAIEAIHAGVPTAVLTDLGITEGLGNAHFLGSGCLASFDDLDDGATPVADPKWARQHGVGVGVDRLRGRVTELLSAELPPLSPFYTTANAPAMLPGLLARYGVAVDGTPLDQPAEGTSALKLAVRAGARRVYRHGLEVVAPTLRKLASL